MKIKRFKNINTFYQNLEAFADQVDSSIKIFKANTFYDDTPKFYFREISQTTTAIYYETGEKPRLYKLKPNKTFLICKHLKIFRKDFIFAFILVSPAHFPFLLLCLISSLFFQELREFLITIPIMWLFFLIMDLSSILKLLDFFDDIANENIEEIKTNDYPKKTE